jgi:hypothetical protein
MDAPVATMDAMAGHVTGWYWSRLIWDYEDLVDSLHHFLFPRNKNPWYKTFLRNYIDIFRTRMDQEWTLNAKLRANLHKACHLVLEADTMIRQGQEGQDCVRTNPIYEQQFSYLMKFMETKGTAPTEVATLTAFFIALNLIKLNILYNVGKSRP